MIKVYTQPGCSPCHHATEYLSRREWQFEEIDIRATPGAIDELRRLGASATPVLVIGARVLMGFDRDAIDEAVAAEASG